MLVGTVSLAAAAAAVVNSTDGYDACFDVTEQQCCITEIVVVGGPENVVSIALISQSWSGTYRRPIMSSSRLVIPNKAISFDFRATNCEVYCTGRDNGAAQSADEMFMPVSRSAVMRDGTGGWTACKARIS